MKRFLFLTFICIFAFLLIGCGDTDDVPAPHEHTLVSHEGKAATCTDYGWSAYSTCSGCGYTTYSVILPLGHEPSTACTPSGDVHVSACTRCDVQIAADHIWGEPTVTAPTCTKQGSSIYTCSDCGAVKSEPIAALGHTLNDGYAPNGSVHSRYCTVCLIIVEHVPHTWESLGAGTEPGCTVDGAETFVCTVCGAERTDILPALGHSYSDTFTPSGDKHTKTCATCGDVLSEDHTWGEPTVTPPTCTEQGSKVYTCTDCGAESSEPTAALGHNHPDTFTPDGDVHTKVCDRCGDTVSVAHAWSEPTVTEPTCTEQGGKRYTCTECGAEKLEDVSSALGHDFTGAFTPEGNVHSRSCSRCDAVSSALHTWCETSFTPPTCTEQGSRTDTCIVCGKEQTVILEKVADAHTAYGWVTTTAATAFEEGERARRCLACNKTVATEIIPADVDALPHLYLEGNYTAATAAKNEVSMTVSYVDAERGSFDGYATIKVQGSSSAAYAKKNYTVKFFKDAEHDSKYKVNLGWGKENKYVIKANWVDVSQARNIVSCRLWGDIVKARDYSELQERLAALDTNGGAIDGYPIAVYMNGVFHGLYTMNVPKDEWMFGMGEKDENGNKPTTEALIAADTWAYTDFYSLIGEFVEDPSTGDLLSPDKGWELRYYGGDDYSWVAESFDALIKFCQDNDGEAFREGIGEHLDVDAAIDYVIFMYANCMRDNASKNMLWATYDGKVWFPTVYDQDGTFGQVWDGVRVMSPASDLPSVKNGVIDIAINYGPPGNNNPKFILWHKIFNNFTAEVLERYDELRETVLSAENMIAELQAFEALIPESLYDADIERWQKERDTWWAGKGKTDPFDYTDYHFDYMYEWIEARMECYDAAMNKIREYYGLQTN